MSLRLLSGRGWLEKACRSMAVEEKMPSASWSSLPLIESGDKRFAK